VHQHRAAEPLGLRERLLDLSAVVSVDGADVLEPEVLEHALRREHVLEALLDAVQGLVERLPDQRRAAERALDQLEGLFVAGVGAQPAEVRGQASHRRRVGAAVVVDDDDQRTAAGAGLRPAGDVVQRLPGHAAGEGAVADERDHRPVALAAHRERLRHAVGVGQRRRRVRVLDPVVLALGPAGIAGQPAGLLEPREVVPAGEHLVHVGLVAGVEDDGVARGVEHPVRGDGQLDDAEVGPQVPAVRGARRHEPVADLRGQRLELVIGQRPQVAGVLDAVEKSHQCRLQVASVPSAESSGPTAVDHVQVSVFTRVFRCR
jgi:hypothetical protein